MGSCGKANKNAVNRKYFTAIIPVNQMHIHRVVAVEEAIMIILMLALNPPFSLAESKRRVVMATRWNGQTVQQ